MGEGDRMRSRTCLGALARRAALAAGLALAVVAAGCGGDEASDENGTQAAAPRPVEIRIGYPVTTLINGQVGLVLERTDILERNGLRGKVVAFTHGPPQNDALAAGRVDVILTSEGPGVLGISQGIDALIVASFGTTRDAVLVKSDSGARSLKDLKGRSIGVPFGTTPFLHLHKALERAGMDPKKDVELVNIGPEELAAALETGSVDAVVYNEPLPTKLEDTAGARAVAEDELAYATVMRRDFLERDRKAAARFLVALAQATLFLATHRDLVNGWFAEASRTDEATIHDASSHTAVYTEAGELSDIDLGIDAAFVERLQADADFFANEGFAESAADMTNATDRELWNEARRLMERASFDPDDVKIEE